MRTKSWAIGLFILLPPCCTAQTPSSSVDVSKAVQPFFQRNCYTCHNSQTKTAGLDLETYAGRVPMKRNSGLSSRSWKTLCSQTPRRSNQIPDMSPRTA